MASGSADILEKNATVNHPPYARIKIYIADPVGSKAVSPVPRKNEDGEFGHVAQSVWKIHEQVVGQLQVR